METWWLPKRLTKGLVTEWSGEYGYNVYGFCLEYYWFWSVFSSYREALLLKLHMTYSNLINYTSVSKLEIFFSSLRLVPLETGDSWVLSSLIRWMGKTVSWHLNIWGTENSTVAESDGRLLAWISWPWEAFWEFGLRRLRSSTTASLEKPM